MKNDPQYQVAPIGNTVMKLAFVGGALLTCMYGALMLFSTALRIFH
ncbi:MAG: hypothetical protein ABI687_11130 [Flavitalea sp.]